MSQRRIYGEKLQICQRCSQNQIRRKKLLTSSIDKSQEYSSCRLCIETNESADHLVSGCSKLAYKEYKKRHNNQIDIDHWELVK